MIDESAKRQVESFTFHATMNGHEILTLVAIVKELELFSVNFCRQPGRLFHRYMLKFKIVDWIYWQELPRLFARSCTFS